ncbi:MAG: hypothetical protein WCC60_06660 [Ilumatobacteraceae bacterium]
MSPPRLLLAAAAWMVITSTGAACSDAPSDGASTTVTASAPAQSTAGTTITLTMDAGSTVPRSSGSAAAPPVTQPIVAAGSTVAVPLTSDPFASTPPTAPFEPDELPGPRLDDCVDAPPGSARVEISFDLDDVRFAGAVAPSCLRIHAAQRIAVRSESAAESAVIIGADAHLLAAGGSVVTEPLGTLFGVGDVFDLYVEALDTTVVVQVLA